MRNRLTSGLLPRLAVFAAMGASLPSAVNAWDEDRVQSQIQPYFGVWLGGYMINTDDLNQMINRSRTSTRYSMDNFNPVMPAAGLSFGVAYSRLHVGVNAGYQLMDGDDIARAATWNVYPSYRYQVIPIDLSMDVALLPNEYPVNLLVGGSAGLGLVGIKNPYKGVVEYGKDGDTTFYYLENEWNYMNALLATGYVGARINLARRLNLEGQVGWRVLTSDGVEIGDVDGIGIPKSETHDSTGAVVAREMRGMSLNLSGAYVRVDVRWTFASEAEKSEDRAAARNRVMTERMAMLPRARLVD